MSFNCKTPSCAIAISKAEFPAAMICPVCQKPLSEVIDSLPQEDLDLIASLPYVIAYPLQQTLLEKYPPQRINLFKDTFLNYLKYLGLLSASEFFNSDIKDKGMVLLFQQNLIETAFGKWNHYIRETLKFLKEQNHTLFCSELATYYETIETGNKSKKHKGEIEFIDANGDIQLKKQEATSIGMLINFRNRYLGHGLTLDAQKAEALWQEYFPIFRNLLEQLSFAKDYPMLKREDGITYLLHSSEITTIDSNSATQSSIWIQNKEGKVMDILPFFIVPGEVSLVKEDKEQMFTYESYTGKTIKFFSPEGTEKQTSGKLLDKLNLLLRDKQKEVPFSPQQFTKEEFLNRITDENKLLLETLVNEKKIIPGVYQHREEMEIKLREWIGARSNIFFIAAEAGSGKTNLLAEIQKQYAERDLPSLLIQAGRMEKQSLKEQIAYLLNIDLQQGLEKYTSFAGTQAEPTFILIDGLNEANYAEAIWQEILSLSTIFEAGSVKFVVTNRANTNADLERYLVSDEEQDFLYGENKDNEKGLVAYTYWLTALDMKEMKGAWEYYVAKDKARFKPLFTFDAIAEFDRGIYNQINNPLILRLFLEIYNGKPLPKKGNKHLHIWSDWFKTFSKSEQTFFTLLADAVWDKGENELLLDDVLNNEILKPYFTSDVINAPYQRLKNLGWISSYTKDLNSYVGFTVEGSLLHLLGVQLQSQKPKIDLEYVQRTLKTNNKLKTAAIEAFLCEETLVGNLDLVSELIDTEDQDISICITPLLLFLKTFGVKATIEKILENPTKNDWKSLLILNNRLADLQLHLLRKDFLKEVMLQNQLQSKYSVWLALKAIALFDKEESLAYLSKIDTSVSFIREDEDILFELAKCEDKLGNYEKALSVYMTCESISLKYLGELDSNMWNLYNNIGLIYYKIGNTENALKYFNKCLEIKSVDFIKIATLWNNMGLVYSENKDYESALIYYEKTLSIDLKIYGDSHPKIATVYNNIGSLYNEKKDFEKSSVFFEKSLSIRFKIFGEADSIIASTYHNMGTNAFDKMDYDKALYYLNKALSIFNITLGLQNPELGSLFFQLGELYNIKKDFDKSLIYYKKSLKVRCYNTKSIGVTYTKIAKIFYDCKDYQKALKYYDRSIVIYLKNRSDSHWAILKIYENIAIINEIIGNDYLAIENYEKCLALQLEYFDGTNSDIANTYLYIGHSLVNLKNYDLAIEKYEKCLALQLEHFDGTNSDFANTYFHIGNSLLSLKKYDLAIENFKEGNKILLKGGFAYKIAQCYEALYQNENALDYYIQCSEIRKKDIGLEHKATQESITNAKRLAKELNKESELPEWMK
jgi:tetratricopeptide (TPR) repeat protein